MHQKLPVAVGPGDRRIGPPDDRAAGGDQCRVDLVSHTVVDRRVGDDAATPVDLLATGFELRFHEEHHGRPRLAQRGQRGDHQPQRDERQVTDHEVDRPADLIDVGVADVVTLEVGHPGVGAQPFVELAVPDVERDDVRRASLQQTIGESTGRCADVEHLAPSYVDAELVQGVVELLGPTTDEPRRRTFDHEGVARSDLPRGLVGDRSVDEDPIRSDQRLCFGAARRELPANELGVEPSTRRHG